MRFRIIAFMAAAVLLAACQTSPSQTSGAGASGSAGGGIPSVTPGTQADLVATVGDRVFFGFDRYDLSSDAQSTLQEQANWLQRYPSVTVTIEGHADERGTREYNLALGERRANAVKNYLVALGIDGGRIRTISYGKERPAVTGSNESAWAQNRRAVMVVN